MDARVLLILALEALFALWLLYRADLLNTAPRLVFSILLLLAAFTLMTVGLYITFFLQPVLVKVDDEGYAVGGPKPEGMRLSLEALLEPDELSDQEE